MSTTDMNMSGLENARSGSGSLIELLGLEPVDMEFAGSEETLFDGLGWIPSVRADASLNLGELIQARLEDPNDDLLLTPGELAAIRALSPAEDDVVRVVWADDVSAESVLTDDQSNNTHPQASTVYHLSGDNLPVVFEPTSFRAKTGQSIPLLEAQEIPTVVTEAAASNKLLTNMGWLAVNLKNRVSEVFAVRDETSHLVNSRATAVLLASAIAIGAAAHAIWPASEGTPGTDPTEQLSEADEAKQIEMLRSRLPKVETGPSGAWVPVTVKVWEEPVRKIYDSQELKSFNLLVDQQLLLATLTAGSLGDAGAKGHNGRIGLLQIPEEEGKKYKPDYNPENYVDSIVAGLINLDQRAKMALLEKDYSKGHDQAKNRADFIRDIIEGPEPGSGYDTVPKYAQMLADRVIQLDANWTKPTNDAATKWMAEADVLKLLNQATHRLLEEGFLVRKKAN